MVNNEVAMHMWTSPEGYEMTSDVEEGTEAASLRQHESIR